MKCPLFLFPRVECQLLFLDQPTPNSWLIDSWSRVFTSRRSFCFSRRDERRVALFLSGQIGCHLCYLDLSTVTCFLSLLVEHHLFLSKQRKYHLFFLKTSQLSLIFVASSRVSLVFAKTSVTCVFFSTSWLSFCQSVEWTCLLSPPLQRLHYVTRLYECQQFFSQNKSTITYFVKTCNVWFVFVKKSRVSLAFVKTSRLSRVFIKTSRMSPVLVKNCWESLVSFSTI